MKQGKESRTAVGARGRSEPDGRGAAYGGPSGNEPARGEVAVEPYIGKGEVARRMGRTTRAVDNLMRRGLVPYYTFDWRVAFRWSEIQAQLAQTCRVSRGDEDHRTTDHGPQNKS